MKKAAMAARVGNRILSIMAGILILLMLSYGVYSLWDTYKIYANSFADEELLKFRPTDDGEDNPTLKDLKKLKIIEKVIREPEPANEENLPEIAEEIREDLDGFLRKSCQKTREQIVEERYERFRRM